MNMQLITSILYIIFAVPLLLYVGFQRAATPEWVYNVLYGIGLLLLVYSGYYTIIGLYAKSSSVWLSLIHLVLVAPLLLWVGYASKKTERPFYELFLIAGFGALGYNIKNIVLNIDAMKAKQ